ncbi:MscL family protein [Kocuria sp. M4R2S49]|uniref:MscL family protein n=1 Tax=Kocuria rhizosphaericola TaxID=3376284 RepID=UPI0037888AA8
MRRGFGELVTTGDALDLAVAVIIGADLAEVVDATVAALPVPFVSAPAGSPDPDSSAMLTVDGSDVRSGVLLTGIRDALRRRT